MFLRVGRRSYFRCFMCMCGINMYFRTWAFIVWQAATHDLWSRSRRVCERRPIILGVGLYAREQSNRRVRAATNHARSRLVCLRTEQAMCVKHDQPCLIFHLNMCLEALVITLIFYCFWRISKLFKEHRSNAHTHNCNKFYS